MAMKYHSVISALRTEAAQLDTAAEAAEHDYNAQDLRVNRLVGSFATAADTPDNAARLMGPNSRYAHQMEDWNNKRVSYLALDAQADLMATKAELAQLMLDQEVDQLPGPREIKQLARQLRPARTEEWVASAVTDIWNRVNA